MTTALPKTMRAWRYASSSPTMEANLKFESNAPLPDGAESLPADQVLVNVLAVSINPIDYKFSESPLLGGLAPKPAIPSMDFAGRVAALGPKGKNPGVHDLSIGQLVYGHVKTPTKFGTMADYTIAPRAHCMPIPKGVGVIDAACAASVALTAYQAIIPKIKGNSQERVFINGGSGAVGTFAIQIAKAIGCDVTVTCSSGNIDLCKSMGADVVIDYKKSDIISELQKMKPFDLVVDNVGLPANLYWAAPSFTNPRAHYVQVGALAITASFLLGNFFKTYWPSWLGGGQRPWEFAHLESKPDDYAQIGQWMQEKKVRAVVDEVYGLEDNGPIKAYARSRTGRARGKVVVQVAESLKE